MPSVHLESDDGVSIRLVDTDLGIDDLAPQIGQLARFGPTITATPTGAEAARFGFVSRLDFADAEIEALQWIVAQQLGIDDDFDPVAYWADSLDPVEFTTLVIVDADDEYRFRLGLGEDLASGMPSPGLREYWLSGEGAAKIRWGTGGDFTRCVSHLREHVGEDAEGTCANLHRDATGMWPGDKANRKAETAADTEELRWNPFQPRAPKGSPEGGQWVPSDGSSIGAVLPTRHPDHTPDEKQWEQRSKRAVAREMIVATPEDRNSRSGKLFGKAAFTPIDEALDILFPNEALTTTVPFRSASRRKGEPLYDTELVAETLADRRVLRSVDPRVLHATQTGLTRDGLRYYLGTEYETTGRTYADQYNRGNATPVVYKNRRGQWMILSGHHRAAAALLRGKPLKAIVIDPDEGLPPTRVGDKIPTRAELIGNRTTRRYPRAVEFDIQIPDGGDSDSDFVEQLRHAMSRPLGEPIPGRRRLTTFTVAPRTTVGK